MIAKVDSPEPEFPLPSTQCLFCKKEGVKGGGVGYVICDLFRYELMPYKTVQFEEYSMCFKCGSVINYVVYIKRLLLTTLFGLPVQPPIFTHELPDISKNLNENVRFILHCNIPHIVEAPILNVQRSSTRKNGFKSSPYLTNHEPYGLDDLHEDTEPLLIETCSTYEEPANIGYHRYNDDRIRSQSEPRTRSRTNSIPKRPKSQLSRTRSKSQAKQHVCKWLNCRLVCQSQRKLSIHYDDEHQFDCTICNQCSFGSRHFLEKHKKENHDRKCKVCKMGIKPDEFRNHCREPHNFICPYCDFKFHKNKHLSEHVRAKHEKRPILELFSSLRFNQDTNGSITSNVNEETEIIILNNKTIQAQPLLVEEEKNPSIAESTININDSSPIIDDNVAPADNTEWHRTDSGIDNEQEISQSLESDLTTINIASLPPAEEITINIRDHEYNASPPNIQNVETSITTTTKNAEDTLPEHTITSVPSDSSGLISSEPPISNPDQSSDSVPMDPPTIIPSIPSVLSSSDLLPIVSDSEFHSIKGTDGTQRQLLGRNRGIRRQILNSIYAAAVPEISLTKSLPINKEVETYVRQEKSNGDVDSPDQAPPDIKTVRRLRKRNLPALGTVGEFIQPTSYSIMNTRSRHRTQAIKQNTGDPVQDDQHQTSGMYSKKARYDKTVQYINFTSQLTDQLSGLGGLSTEKTNKRNISESTSLHSVNKKLSKASAKNPVHTIDTSTLNTGNISVDSDVKVNVNKKSMDTFFKKIKRNSDIIGITKSSTDTISKDKTNEALSANLKQTNILLSVTTIKASDPPSPLLLENKSKTTPYKQSEISNQIGLKNINEGIYNLPGFYTEIINTDNIPQKDEEIKSTNISETFIMADNNVNQLINLSEKQINSSDRLQSVIIPNITVSRIDDHESNDSASSCTSLTIIHEEGFNNDEEILPSNVETSNDHLPINKQNNTERDLSTNLNAIKTISNMDKIIESVVKATDVISRTKGQTKKLSKSKNVESELFSPSKPTKSVGSKIVAGKTVKLIPKSSKSSNISSSPRKNTKIPSEDTSTREVNTNSDMNSLARYMMSKLDREKSTCKSNSTYSSILDDNVPLSNYTKPSSNKTANALPTDAITFIDNTFASFQKPNAKRTPDLTVNSLTTDVSFSIVGSLSKEKQSMIVKKRGRNKKERSDRRAINFDEFIADRDTLSITKSKPESQPTDRVPKQDAYAFPETENSHESPEVTQVDLTTGVSKTVSHLKQKLDHLEPPVKKKSRVKSKPRRNTAFDNIITEASQRYYKK